MKNAEAEDTDERDEPGERPEPTPEDLLAEAQEQFLRAQADLQNMRKRMEKDVEERVQYRMEALLHDLIRVADYMEAALGGIPEPVRAADQAASFLAGMEAIRQALDAVMLGHGMVFLAPGEDTAFDPEEHEAVETVEVEGLEKGRLRLLSRGYRIGRRILRPAQVRLETPPSAAD